MSSNWVFELLSHLSINMLLSQLSTQYTTDSAKHQYSTDPTKHQYTLLSQLNTNIFFFALWGQIFLGCIKTDYCMTPMILRSCLMLRYINKQTLCFRLKQSSVAWLIPYVGLSISRSTWVAMQKARLMKLQLDKCRKLYSAPESPRVNLPATLGREYLTRIQTWKVALHTFSCAIWEQSPVQPVVEQAPLANLPVGHHMSAVQTNSHLRKL